MTLRDVWAEGFHTFWRKGSDTDLSSVIWNLVHLLPPDIWTNFTAHVTARISDRRCSEITGTEIKRAVRSWDCHDPSVPIPSASSRHATNAFAASLRMIADAEYEDLVAWFQALIR